MQHDGQLYRSLAHEWQLARQPVLSQVHAQRRRPGLCSRAAGPYAAWIRLTSPQLEFPVLQHAAVCFACLLLRRQSGLGYRQLACAQNAIYP